MPEQITDQKRPISDSLNAYLETTLKSIPTTKRGTVGFGVSPTGAEVSAAYTWKTFTIAGYAVKDFKGGFGAGFKGMFSF